MGRSRGQIVLVAAFALAITFVTLSLILNTAIFTENLATRQTAETQDAADFQDAVVETGSVLLWETNRNESNYADLRQTYRKWIENYSDAENHHALREGTLRSVTLYETKNGSRIYQETTTSLTDENGTTTWLVAKDVGDVRAFTLNVSAADQNSPLVVNATNGSATWELEITNNGTAFDATVTNVSGETTTRSTTESTLELSPTNGSFEDAAWTKLTFQEQFSGSYDLYIRNGSNASGTYNMVVDKKTTAISWDNSSAPALDPAIYNASVGIDLNREDLSYRANFTIEPQRRFPQ